MKPISLLIIGIAGILTLNVGVAIQSLPVTAYGALTLGFMFGALVRSKEN